MKIAYDALRKGADLDLDDELYVVSDVEEFTNAEGRTVAKVTLRSALTRASRVVEIEKPIQTPQSCHVLELSVEPGGARFAELYASAKAADLAKALAKFCKNRELAGYLSMYYGALLGVWTVEEDTVSAFLDLHEHLRVSHARFGAVVLAHRDRYGAFVKEIEESAAWSRFAEVEITFDWDAIANRLRPLKHPLRRGGRIASVTVPRNLRKAGSYFAGLATERTSVVFGRSEEE